MIAVTSNLLEQMTEVIVHEVNPDRIYLMGSRGRGEGLPDSDVDLLVVESEAFGPGRSRLARINQIMDALAAFRIPTDILLYSRNEFEEWKSSINHVIGRCHREGKLLYERR